jgi:ABC-type transport system involved in cytochrome bd biosynthesis fused ATPase/permease subunit
MHIAMHAHALRLIYHRRGSRNINRLMADMRSIVPVVMMLHMMVMVPIIAAMLMMVLVVVLIMMFMVVPVIVVLMVMLVMIPMAAPAVIVRHGRDRQPYHGQRNQYVF